MAYEVPNFKLGTLTAAASLTTAQFKLVKVTAANAVNVSSAATDATIGILQNNPASGEAAEITIIGVSKAVAGAATAAGAELMADASGRLITAAAAAGANRVLAIGLEAATAANEIISVLLFGGPIRMI